MHSGSGIVQVKAAGVVWREWLGTLAILALCTLVAESMAPYLDLADQIMVYLAGVVYVALHYGLAPSLGCVIASVFLFDLIFVPPRWGLNPLNKQHLLTFAVMLAVGLLISRLAAHARQQTVLAQARARRAQALNELSARLAVACTAGEVADGVAAAVQLTFGARCTVLPPDAPDAAGDALRLPLKGTGSPLGSLEIAAMPAHPHSPEEHDLLSAFAHQTALALERCAFEQKSADALVEAETERLRNTLLSGISHDFHTPLTAIVGSATSLLQQDRLLDGHQRLTLTRGILAEATRMHALVSDLLDLTRLEEGAVQLAFEWCPADEMMESVLATVGPRASSHQIHVQISPDAIVWCDPRLLEQALVNLVDNALRHTPAGTRVNLEVAVQGQTWSVVVSDNGPGLPPGSERDVFKKFHRGRAEPSGTGTGLGLAICAAVARLHSGSITAANDGGARFTLTLPQIVRVDSPLET